MSLHKLVCMIARRVQRPGGNVIFSVDECADVDADDLTLVARRGSRTATALLRGRHLRMAQATTYQGALVDLIVGEMSRLSLIVDPPPPPMFRIGTRPHPKRWSLRKAA